VNAKRCALQILILRSAINGGVWRIFERARVRFGPFLRMGSSDDAETGATQVVANQIGAAPCRCEWKSHSLVLRGGASFSPYFFRCNLIEFPCFGFVLSPFSTAWTFLGLAWRDLGR
jgi:hypothetical protein